MDTYYENHHPNETNDDLYGPPDGFEADWLKWRSRMNRCIRFARRPGPLPTRNAAGKDDPDSRPLPSSDESVT